MRRATPALATLAIAAAIVAVTLMPDGALVLACVSAVVGTVALGAELFVKR